MIFSRFAFFSALITAFVRLTSTSASADTSKFVGEDAAQAYAAYAIPFAEGSKQWGSPCFLNLSLDKPEELKESECMPKRGAKKTAIIFGDSSMAMYAGELKAKFAQAGYSMGQLTSSLCPPIANFHLPARPFCEKYNDRFYDLILRAKPSIVVMSWYPHAYNITSEQLASTVNNIRLNGSKVVILGSHPFFYGEVRLILAGRARSNDPNVMIDATQNPQFKTVEDNEKLVRQTITNRASGVSYVSVLSTVCPNQTCILAVNGKPLYYDSDHVTPLGSALNTERFFPLLLK